MHMNNDQELAELRWDAVSQGTDSLGEFYYAVKTTGVVCRSGCPSKLPNRENVVFYDSVEAAKEDGYRPCKRCRPV